MVPVLPFWGFPIECSGKESTCQCRRCKRCLFDPLVEKIPWSRKWHPIPVFLFGNFHGQRSLVGYSPRGHKVVVCLVKAMVFPVVVYGCESWTNKHQVQVSAYP